MSLALHIHPHTLTWGQNQNFIHFMNLHQNIFRSNSTWDTDTYDLIVTHILVRNLSLNMTRTIVTTALPRHSLHLLHEGKTTPVMHEE